MSEIKYRAIKYIRLSSADEKSAAKGGKGESDSVGNQRKLIDEYLKGHPEIEVVGEKVDDGFSGLLFDRPAFKEMMEDIENGKVNCCITKDLSRLGREYIEMGRYLRRIFPAYGVRFIAINDNIDTLNDKPDDLTVSLQNLINDSYCRDISVKTRSVLERKRESGEYIGACPVYGYAKTPDDKHRLEPDPYAAEIVRDIFRMKLDGNSSARIADILNERGVLSPYIYKKDRGAPHPKKGFADKAEAKWSAQTIIRILKDEVYTGTLIQGKCETPNYKLKERRTKPESEWHRHEHAHDAIISRNDFDLVQRLLQLDTRTSPGCDKVYVFSGLLICGCCGNRMIRKSAPGKDKRYYNYWCPTTKKGGCTDSVMMKEDDLMQCVLDCLKAYISNVVSLETLIANTEAEEIGQRLADRLTEQLAMNERRIAAIRKYKAGLHENLIDGNLTKEEHNAMRAQYVEDEAELTVANERLRGEIEDALACKHERLTWMARFREFENLEVLDRKIVATLIKCIRIIGKREIEIEFNYQAEYDAAFEILRKEAA